MDKNMAIMVLSSVLSAATRADAVVLVIGGASPGFNGKPGWARLTSWIWLILSQLETMAVSGGLRYSRTTLNAHESQTRLRLDWMPESLGWHTQSDPVGVDLFSLSKVTVGERALAQGWPGKPLIPLVFLFTV
ncbi:hypothetical protein [Polaromonas sp. JS666]|uniref:hypothetical protein n=1 Tax=Polaromonas sp. (strain JS666 / ATCC BAA-500) TaxID=296591 RepID=UPI00059DEF31